MNKPRLSPASFVCLLLAGIQVQAGEPPFPNELGYPNIIRPKYQFGEFGLNVEQFAEPTSVAFSDDGKLIISEAGSRRIKIVEEDGTLVKTWTGGDAITLVRPVGVHAKGSRIVVVDSGESEVHLLSYPELDWVRSFGRHEGISLNRPNSAWLHGERLLIADTGNDRIADVDITSGSARYYQAGGAQLPFNSPSGVTVDGEGAIYVADAWNNRIVKLSTNGEFLSTWGEWGSHQGLFATPSSVTASGYHIYVTDLTNHRIQVFDREGNFLFQWGRHPPSGHEGDGRTHYPTGLAINADESLYALAEPIEHRIQVFAKAEFKNLKNVNDSAWWDKATRFHYGSRISASETALYVSEPDTHSVLAFDITGKKPQFIVRMGGQGSDVGKLIEPSGMIAKPGTDEILVSDTGNHRLQTFTLRRVDASGLPVSAGKFLLGAAAAKSTRFLLNDELPQPLGKGYPEKMEFRERVPNKLRPGSIAIAPNGAAYIYDQVESRIVVADLQGTPKFAFGSGYGSAPDMLKNVTAMSFSKDGQKLFIVDGDNFRIQITDLEGKVIGSFGAPGTDDGQFLHPFGIASGIDGFVYVSDESHHNISKFDETGKFIKRWGRFGMGDGEFYKPKGIVQTKDGRIYVLNFGNHRGDIFSPEGEFLDSFGLAEPGTKEAELVGRLALTPTAYDSRQLFSRLNDPNALKKVASLYSGRLSGRDLSGVQKTQGRFSADLVHGEDLAFTFEVPPIGEPIESVSVSAQMPQHGHGLARKPVARIGPDKLIEVQGLRFQMPGIWELYIDVATKHGAMREEFLLDVQ